MDLVETENQIVDLINNAKNIAIVPSKIVDIDGFTAGVALYHLLKGKEKNVSFVYEGKEPDNCSRLIDQKEITSDVSHKELLVSIDYSGTTASKVHYSTEDDVLYLKISPINKDFDLNKVKARVKGYDFDVVFTVGVQGLEDLGQIYRELSNDFAGAKIINLDNTERNQRFGNLNVVDSSEESLCLLVLDKALGWGLKVNKKAAKALLTGITYKTGS